MKYIIVSMCIPYIYLSKSYFGRDRWEFLHSVRKPEYFDSSDEASRYVKNSMGGKYWSHHNPMQTSVVISEDEFAILCLMGS